MKSIRKPFERLPTAIVPINYRIKLIPNLEQLTFEGEECVEVKIDQPTERIVLNSSELVINQTDANSNFVVGDEKISIKEIQYDADDEKTTLLLSKSLPVGFGFLNLSFRGTINDKLRGFYKSKYIGPDGLPRITAVTQFEPTSARFAFPCWDEPAIKATFDITMVVPNDGKTCAISNMAIAKEESSNNLRTVTFHRTPIMSTYLLAFVVGEFDYIEAKSKHGVLVRVYAQLGKSELGRLALDVATKSLDYYTDYFKIPYPLDKLDLIAVSDFEAGAMENWGLVTYRETCLLIDAANSSSIRKQNVALTVAHELAHQWFGNLVTMEWWTHLWLNEGFATFMEYLCIDCLSPEFNVWNQFVSDVLSEALHLDSLDNSHPIEIPVGHPSEIDEIFDNISYSKGASVIRMLYYYIGDEAFRKGMNLYLSRHSYKNTQTEDLWDALEEASKKPIRRIMSTWTQQKGYPIIKAELKSEDKMRLFLQQKKFNASGKMSESDSKMLWANPVQIVTKRNQNNPGLEILLETKEDALEIEPLDSNEWLKLNSQAIGTYRVQYDDELLKRLLGVIENLSINPVDRLNILDDLYSMTLCGHTSSDKLLNALGSFQNESNFAVWSVINQIFGKYNQLLFGTNFYPKFVEFATQLITKKAYPNLGWHAKPNEPHLDALLRSMLINRLVSLDYSEIIKLCQQAFQDHVTKKKIIPADLRSAVYHAMALQCDETIWDTLMKV
ncbi:26S proteasome non-ATPase regulatory subunit 1 [Sarcoptes scabiei]|nr:26S proteasome non-ATPase regulatory subunit 1 [Sarcoptes scabiei]